MVRIWNLRGATETKPAVDWIRHDIADEQQERKNQNGRKWVGLHFEPFTSASSCPASGDLS